MGELYWMALCRDVAFRDYGTGANTDAAGNTAAAATSLSTMPIVAGGEFTQFMGPKVGDTVTPATLFRGFTRGDLVGPYLSQFLLKGTSHPVLSPPPDNGVISYGTLGIDQRQRTVLPPGAGTAGTIAARTASSRRRNLPRRLRVGSSGTSVTSRTTSTSISSTRRT
jgi:hypothetical protein